MGINGGDKLTEEFCINNNVKYTIQEKLGMYSATNLAAKEVKKHLNNECNNFLVITNDDIYLDNMFFISLSQWLTQSLLLNERNTFISNAIQPEVAGGTYKPYYNHGKTYDEFNTINFLEYCRKIESPTYSFHNFGIVYAIHQNDWNSINGFDEQFDPYGGGMADLMYRLFLSGIRNFKLIHNVLHYHFISKCVNKHTNTIHTNTIHTKTIHTNINIKNGDTTSQKFKNKWNISFEDIDNIMKNASNRTKTISTYITTFNSLFFQSTLEQTIKHALLFSDEIIISNSSQSSDGTNDLLNNLKSEYPNIIKIYTYEREPETEPDFNYLATRKTYTLKKCKCDYAILQDDDEAIHEKYAKYIRQLPSICPDALAFRFNTIHFYRSYNHYQPPSKNWYKSKIYMIKNIPEIKHGKVKTDIDNFLFWDKSDNYYKPLSSHKKVIEVPITSYHYGWCRNDAVLLIKKYFQEVRWHGKDYWKSHEFPFKFENPTTLPIYNETHPKYIQEMINNEKYNTKWINEFTIT